MFDQLAGAFSIHALTDQVSSYLTIPVIAPVLFAPVAVALVVLGTRAVSSLVRRGDPGLLHHDYWDDWDEEHQRGLDS